MKTGMRIEGFDEADRNLADLRAMADRGELRDLGISALEPVAAGARGLVRQRSGRLERSIGTGDQLSPAQAAASHPAPGTVDVYVGPGALPEAITEEFGTVHEQGHPFMRPAWDSNLGAVLARLRQGAGERLRRITKG
jgi:hypothetical protein